MTDATTELWSALHANHPFVLVEYATTDERDELLATLREMLSDRGAAMLTSAIKECLENPNTPILFVPAVGHQTDAQVLETFDGRREQFLERTQPIVIMLLRGGDAVKRLPQLPGLASWVGSRWVDPTTLDERAGEQDLEDFTLHTGMTPQAWLDKDRNGEFADTLENNLLRHRARSLADVLD